MKRSNIPGSKQPRAAGEASTAPSAALHFHIGRLTLEGYTRADGQRFVGSLQDSLQTGLAELAHKHPSHDWAAAKLRMSRLDAGRLPAGASPEQAAQHIAAQIFLKLTGNGGKSDA